MLVYNIQSKYLKTFNRGSKPRQSTRLSSARPRVIVYYNVFKKTKKVLWLAIASSTSITPAPHKNSSPIESTTIFYLSLRYNLKDLSLFTQVLRRGVKGCNSLALRDRDQQRPPLPVRRI
mmetsp:Transcript_1368/g.1450  ORF Transcript_1368/g.1450 Transcript_1368/m.1450 type:complete len:120 (+) Transcript_1368:275-634(+)